MTCAAGGSIHYTTNGIDPRVHGTAPSYPEAPLYTKPVPISDPVLFQSACVE